MSSSDRAHRSTMLATVVGLGLVSVLAVTGTARATDLGVFGPVYAIREPDLLRTIEATLESKSRSGELARLQREGLERAKRSLHAPAPVPGLARTTVPRVHYLEPVAVAPQDIRAPDGTVVVRAGTRINPLDHVPLRTRLLFFDGRDAAQTEYARRAVTAGEGEWKPILVGGSFVDLARTWKRRVYYDFGGVLVRRLTIRQVPALVSQDGQRLRIEETAP